MKLRPFLLRPRTILVGLLLASGPLHAQVTQQWVTRYNGPANSGDYATATAVDSAGNVAVTGASYNGTNDYYTAKYAATTGALLWEKRYNGTGNSTDEGYSVAVDTAGNVAVTGLSYNGTSYDYYTAKYAGADGSLLWEKRYNGTGNSTDQAYSVAVDGAGNVAVTGLSYNGTNYDYYTAKYAAADGALLWEKRYNGTGNNYDAAFSVAVDSAGNVAVTGESSNGANLDYYTAKYAAADGALLWEKRYNGTGNSNDVAYSVAVDSAGNVAVTGLSYNASGNLDYYTAKYAAADGALLWEKRYNGTGNNTDQAYSVAVDGAGNVAVTGQSYNGTNYDYYTAKYAAADGALLWEKRYDGTGNNYDAAFSVAVDTAGNVAVTGESSNGANLDYYTAKYAAADGALLWEQRYNGPANSEERMDGFLPYSGKLALTPNGGTVVTGQSYNGTNYDYATVKYAPAAIPAQASFTTGMDASVVVGQANFTDQLTTASQVVMAGPAGAAVSATGKLAISDQEDGRVLIWNTIPSVNGTPADVVVGKPDFTDITGGTTASRMGTHIDTVTFSQDGTKLIAADSLNNRVLIWNTVPTTNGAAADVVIGQTDFVTATSGTSTTKLFHPAGLAVTPDGKLLIAEVGNSRVLVYNSIPTVNGAAANVVIGQADFVSSGAGSGANQMNQPWGVTVSPVDGRLLVTDGTNNRVLVFNSVPTTNGASANVVIGQTGFGLGVAGGGATGLKLPFAAAVSAAGKLAISDGDNSRVLIYNSIPTTNGAAANVVLGQPDFTTTTGFTGGISARSMASAYGVAFTADGRLIVPGTNMQRAMIFGRFVAPVTTSFGDVITDNGAPNAAGADSGADFDQLQRSGYLAQNGNLAFLGYLKTGVGGVDNTNFMGYWKHDGISLKLLARQGDNAPETGATAAKFNILPLIPGISDGGQVTLLASLLQSGQSTPATTASNDIGLWSELGGTGLGILMREDDAIPGLGGPQVDSFGYGCFATATTGASTGEAAFVVGMKGSSTETALLRTSVTGPTVTAVGVIARENTTAPGAGENFAGLNNSVTRSVRMDATGNVVFAAGLASGKVGIWYQDQTTMTVGKSILTGDAAPGTTATFQQLDLPNMGGGGAFAFRGVLNAVGDNASNAKNDGIWKATGTAAPTLILRRGDNNTNRPGLFSATYTGTYASIKAGNIYNGWLTNANHGAWLGWVDLGGDGISAFPYDGNFNATTDTFGIYTDTSGTMTLLIASGDAAPGIAGSKFFFIDHPVCGGTEQVAFIATVNGGGITSANNKGIWRTASNGGALSLALRTGDTMSVNVNGTPTTKTIADLDLPGSGYADHLWETPVMDGTGRLLVFVTFTDGSTTQVLVP